MFTATRLSYSQTAAFSPLVTDYLAGAEALRPFYAHPPTWEGMEQALDRRRQVRTDRPLLVQVLNEQYAKTETTAAVKANIESLLSEDAFTVCTAHQPNLFTGPLYFLYKILHAVRLAQALNERLPQNRFVPVYYMGSEDADFAELNHTYVDGKKLEWRKEQGGAVGRMAVDKTLLNLIDELEGQLSVEAHGAELIALLRKAYVGGRSIQEATFGLINELYGAYGLLVLIPDHPRLKAQMKAVFEDDLFRHTPRGIVQKTTDALSEAYKAQAFPRDINLFYLKDDIRERIEETEGRYTVLNTGFSFSEEELRQELNDHPERFSPNVILRGLYQETILPNMAFVGGGGELAYWLQLKDLFAQHGVPFPVLVLRNSFLVMEEKRRKKAEALGLSAAQLFRPETELLTELVRQKAEHPVSLDGTLESASALSADIKQRAARVDATLLPHAAAIEARWLKALHGLERKMLRAEKRKHTDLAAQLHKLKASLFPNEGLQERVENFSLFYAKWGAGFINALYQHSPALEQEFTVLAQTDAAAAPS